MQQQTIAPGHWLAPAPAASYARMIRDGCPPGITSAGRTTAEQRSIFLARYRPQATGSGPYGDVVTWQGVRYVRVSGPSPASPPGSVWSLHERGDAIDVPEPARAWIRTHGAPYGWVRDTVPGEPWHMVYQPDRDTRPGSVIPLPTDLPEDTMRRITHTRTKKVALPKGAWTTAPIDDKGNTSACTVAGRGLVVADLTLTGVPKGKEVQARVIVVDTDPAGKGAKIVSRGRIVEIIGTGGSTFGQIVAPIDLPKVTGTRSRRARVQILALDAGVTLTALTTTTDLIPA